MWAHVGSLYGGRRPDALLESLARLLQAGRIRPGQVRLQLAGPVDPAWRGPQLGDPELGAPQLGVIEKLRQAGCLEVKARELPRAEAPRQVAQLHQLLEHVGQQRRSAHG